MLGSSLLRVAGAAPRLAGPRCQIARQLSSQASRALTSLVTPSKARWQEPQPQRSSRGRAYAGFAGHEAGYKSATCKEVGEEVTKGAVKYLDVRTPEEFQAGHAPGASNVPVWLKAGGGMQPNPDFLSTVEAQFADKGTPLIVGCKSGKRSEVACDMMTKAGFSGLTNLLGGFDAWAAEGLPVEK